MGLIGKAQAPAQVQRALQTSCLHHILPHTAAAARC